MSTCNTCGNNTSLPCGCEDIALTMSCTNLIGLNCPPDVNQCASIECAECVTSCGQEDSWAATSPSGGNYLYVNGWSLLQYQQSTAVINAIGVTALATGYFTLFTCPSVTSTTVQLQWSFLLNGAGDIPNGFQIEYREVTDPASDWVVAATVPYGNTSYTISAANVPLTPGIQYQFRMQSLDANNDPSGLDFQSVWINVTIPN